MKPSAAQVINQSSLATVALLDRPYYPGSNGSDPLKEVVEAIARQTRKGVRRLAAAIARVGKYAVRKWNEGAEIHNRQMTSMDERYSANWYFIRSVM